MGYYYNSNECINLLRNIKLDQSMEIMKNFL